MFERIDVRGGTVSNVWRPEHFVVGILCADAVQTYRHNWVTRRRVTFLVIRRLASLHPRNNLAPDDPYAV